MGWKCPNSGWIRKWLSWKRRWITQSPGSRTKDGSGCDCLRRRVVYDFADLSICPLHQNWCRRLPRVMKTVLTASWGKRGQATSNLLFFVFTLIKTDARLMMESRIKMNSMDLASAGPRVAITLMLFYLYPLRLGLPILCSLNILREICNFDWTVAPFSCSCHRLLSNLARLLDILKLL